jgi:lipoprotein-releasing system permease protein
MIFGFRVAIRYLLSGGGQTILMVSLVMIGVTAYTFITATVQGVQSNVIDSTLGSSSHVTIEPWDRLPVLIAEAENILPTTVQGQQRDKVITDWKSVLERIEGLPGIVAVSPSVVGSGFAIRGTQLRPISIKGGFTEEVNGIVDLRKDLTAGSFLLDSGGCVIGVTLARKLNLGIGDKFRIQSEKLDIASFQVRGIVYAGTPAFDETNVFVYLPDAQRLLRKTGAITSIETKLYDLWDADKLADRIQDRTGLEAKPWNRENGQIMSLITSQNLATGVIRAFALLSVAVGIASVLNVTVTQKSKEIGILKSMGARGINITSTFVALGGLIGVVGGIFGAILSYASTVLVGGLTKAAPKGTPSFTMDFRPEYIWQAVAVAIVVAMLGAIIPSRKAARLDPVEAIRA